MHAISVWARNHVWPSRLMIAFLLYPMLHFSAIGAGIILEYSGWIIDPGWNYLFAGMVILTFFLYSKKLSYWKRKFFDFALAFCTFCLVGIGANRVNQPQAQSGSAAYAAMDTPTSVVKKETKKKGLFKKIVHWLKAKFFKKKNTGAIILVVLLGLAALAGLGALSCSIACNGSEALAIVVGVIGGGLIIFGVVKWIQSISRKSSS